MVVRKPIMSPAVERQVMNAVVQYTNRGKWKAWGLNQIRKQGAGILLVGPSGCGKTVIAEWVALKVRRKGIKSISFADFGSGDPGKNARNIRELFKSARENGNMTIYMDECEAILIDRDDLGPDAKWMLEVIDELLHQAGIYEGLVIYATNKPGMLDPAIDRRVLATIEIPFPEFPERIALWNQKLPDAFPMKLSPQELQKIATLQASGAEIEIAIINASNDAIRQEMKAPTFRMLYNETSLLIEHRQREKKTKLQS